VQGHYCNARCLGGLLRVARLCHISDTYTIFSVTCKGFCFGHLSPVNCPASAVGCTGQLFGKLCGVSEPYATDIRAGKRQPLPMHWLFLARLAGVQLEE
jgi:hypothetical protein